MKNRKSENYTFFFSKTDVFSSGNLFPYRIMSFVNLIENIKAVGVFPQLPSCQTHNWTLLRWKGTKKIATREMKLSFMYGSK